VWRRLHIRNLVIFIYLHSLGLRNVKMNYLMIVLLTSNERDNFANELDVMKEVMLPMNWT